MRNPQSADEWQEAVDAAHVMLAVHQAELYGLVEGPEVDVDRCAALLKAGAVLGYHPAADAVQKAFSADA